VNWSDNLIPHLIKFADLQGFPSLTMSTLSRPTSVTKHKSHVSKKEQGMLTPTQMETEEKLYKKLMDFTPEQNKLLKRAFF